MFGDATTTTFGDGGGGGGDGEADSLPYLQRGGSTLQQQSLASGSRYSSPSPGKKGKVVWSGYDSTGSVLVELYRPLQRDFLERELQFIKEKTGKFPQDQATIAVRARRLSSNGAPARKPPSARAWDQARWPRRSCSPWRT